MRHVELLVLGLAAGCASASANKELQLPEPAAAETAAPALSGGELQAMVAAMPVAGNAAAAATPQAKPDAAGGDVQPQERFQPPYREDRLIGPNAQPEWTTERRFTTTDVYVLAPGQIVLEQWVDLTTPKGSGPNWEFKTGVGVGIENQMQFDVYENYAHPDGGPTKHDAVELQGRYAFGRWDRYALNPAVEVVYQAEHDAADFLEGKFLIADDFRSYGWRWAANLFLGSQLSGPQRVEWGASAGISKMLIDSKLSLGVEGRYRDVSFEHEWSDSRRELLFGPSMQWRPTENTHLDVVPLFGFSHSDRDEPRMELMLVFGIDIGQPRRDTIKPDGSTIK